MEVNKFVRYSEFQRDFGINLKKYSQEIVTKGNKGDYYQFLISLRNLLKRHHVKSKKRIEELMKEIGMNTSLPGLNQVLVGLGIITKVEGSHYIMNVNRIDTKLAEFLFEYNHFKQLCLNNEAFKNDDLNDVMKHMFGKFEENIIDRNTLQIRSRSPKISKLQNFKFEAVSYFDFNIEAESVEEALKLFKVKNPEASIEAINDREFIGLDEFTSEVIFMDDDYFANKDGAYVLRKNLPQKVE